jgi:hypothetical protein
MFNQPCKWKCFLRVAAGLYWIRLLGEHYSWFCWSASVRVLQTPFSESSLLFANQDLRITFCWVQCYGLTGRRSFDRIQHTHKIDQEEGNKKWLLVNPIVPLKLLRLHYWKRSGAVRWNHIMMVTKPKDFILTFKSYIAAWLGKASQARSVSLASVMVHWTNSKSWPKTQSLTCWLPPAQI